jgi:hypothetical protein
VTDKEDPEKQDTVWKLEITHPDGQVESGELTVPATPEEPFNRDGFWKAVLVSPEDGRLYCVPLTAFVCDVVEAPPLLFIRQNDTEVECKDVPGFVCALGTDQDEATVLRDIAREYAEGIEAWRDAFAWARSRARRRKP